MQHTKTIKNQANEQDGKFIAFDARKRNEEGIKLYSKAQIAEGDQLKRDVAEVFTRSRVFLNYREKFIVVKVEKPQRADIVSIAAGTLEAHCSASSYDIVKTDRGYLFRIPRV